MPEESLTYEQWLALLRGIADALEAGSISVAQLQGSSLDQLAAASEAGWDTLDAVIAEGKQAGHEASSEIL